MSTHQLIATVARNLKVSESNLLDLEQRRWICSVSRNGNIFLSGRDALKARFIFHLRRLRLTDDEIELVLATQDPPYSLAQIPQILGRAVPLR
jgi:hypothetical protein